VFEIIYIKQFALELELHCWRFFNASYTCARDGNHASRLSDCRKC